MNKLIVILIIIASSNTHAQVYKCVKNSTISYSDKPCNGTANNSTSSSSSDLKDGMSAYELGNYDLAYKKLAPLSMKGDAMAQNTLGRMYMQGSGVTQDFNEAFALFQKAAGKGLPNAQSNLGVLYASGKGVEQDYKLSINWFKKAANQGYKLAMLNLADMYEKGLGTYPDKAEATKWRNKSDGVEVTKEKDLVSVETVGNSEYQYGLLHYYRGMFPKAFDSFLKAAKEGNPESQLRVALMYRQGQGIKKDEMQAQYWAKKAEDGKHSLSDKRQRVLINNGPILADPVPQPMPSQRTRAQ